MLYITTRSSHDAHTAYRSLCTDVAADGGRYLPFKMLQYAAEEIALLHGKSFSQVVAEILNTFFNANLSGMDVDFCIGKNTVKAITMNHRICIAELWHNPQGSYDSLVSSLNDKIYGKGVPSTWFKIAVRIAVLFGLYAQLRAEGVVAEEQLLDIAVDTTGFVDPIAAIYARQMGLPIGTVICTSVDDSTVWDIIHHGSFAANIDSCLSEGLEQLLYISLGRSAAAKYIEAISNKKGFKIGEAEQPLLSAGLFCSVVGNSRTNETINKVYRSNNYLITPSAALCYGGLQDYRAKTGSTSMTLLLSDRTPMSFTEQISKATGLDDRAQLNILRHS